MLRIHWRMAAEHHTLLASHGLTLPQFIMLTQLTNEPGLSQQTLAERLSVTKGNVSGMIERLEQVGLVQRTPDPDDRRSNQLYATEAGHRAVENAAPEIEQDIAEKFAVLTDEEQTTLLNLLARLDRSLKKG
jgi:DNA-binding MarR family transcriptional regulator